MRKNLLRILAVSMPVIILTSCADAELEKRVADLEERVAKVENGGMTATNEMPPVQQVSNMEKEKPEGPLPEIKFAEESHDFGTINEGDVVEHTFSFTNTGEKPLVISNAAASCGCTVPSWPKDPIAPGETGEITARFNSTGKPNQQSKTITITANTYPEKNVLRIKANVLPKTNGPVSQ
ncbi:DUF1573 domain-containing protein [Roseivirga sp. BDSF3-8]|uniref:DUF1573 domain-containing protein n=1 Tax=Roseivirga sp. BDSF3-8 TaxID=3241598 RepID=UPI003531F619